MQFRNFETSRQTIKFEAYGVRVGIDSNNALILEEIENHLPKIVPNEFKKLHGGELDHLFFINENTDAKIFEIYKNSERIEWWTDKNALLDYLNSQLRITVAEFAVSKVFLHAGVIGWKGGAIVIPGTSYSGKTSLVAEFIKHGAVYYSDEYAVIDERGLVHPFPKMLSIRGIIDEYTQKDFAPEELGATVGIEPLPVKLVLLTKFEKGAVWKPSKMKTGEGIMEILQHTIPIRNNPVFTLKVLKKMVSRAIIAKSSRGEAKQFVPVLMNFMKTEVGFE